MATTERIQASLQLSCEELGFRDPPHRVHVRTFNMGTRWIVFLWSQDGQPEALHAWVSKHGTFTESPTSMRSSDRLLVLQTDRLPGAWAALFTNLEVDQLRLDADGSAHVVARGQRETIQKLLSGDDDLRPKPMVQQVKQMGAAEETARRLLTPRQSEAMLKAAAAGYYQVPRRIHLDELAERMDVSTGALSELLRRAEERLVGLYIQLEVGGMEELMSMEF